MSTVKANAFVDGAGGNTATVNGVTVALSSQAQAEAGTDNTTQMTPLRVAQAIATEAVGLGQTWQTVTRTAGVSYQNTTGKPIQIAVKTGGSGSAVQVSVDNVTWITVDANDAADYGHSSAIIPPNYYYRVTVSAPQIFSELR
jgi:hypothetical protein